LFASLSRLPQGCIPNAKESNRNSPGICLSRRLNNPGYQDSSQIFAQLQRPLRGKTAPLRLWHGFRM
jgi:hypothetical protein